MTVTGTELILFTCGFVVAAIAWRMLLGRW